MSEASEPTRVGVVSDTHGLLRPEVLEWYRGVDLILHAGDVGDPQILTDLATLAPLRAVWGNVDGWEVRRETEETVEVEVNRVRIAVEHGHRAGGFDALPDRHPAARVVVHGHSHEPKVDRRPDGRIVLNPGSAGPKRFRDPVTAALLRVGPDGELHVDVRDLESGDPWTPEE